MDLIVSFVGSFLGRGMKFCYDIVANYGIAILLFTFLTKIVLLPISIMLHKNSIEMIKMQPELNFIKVNHFGDADRIGEEQLKLYKKYHYHPMLGLIPIIVQLVLLMGVIDVIYKPLKHIFRISADKIHMVTSKFSELSGVDAEMNSIQIIIVDAVKKGFYTEEIRDILGEDIFNQIQNFNMSFMGINLAEVPAKAGGILILVPIFAAFCAWLLCVIQNKVNVLQSEQRSINKAGTMILSVGLSLYLGFFVPAGVGVYWMIGNLLVILQLLLLNYIINPKKYIDYKQLEISKIALEKISRRAKANKKLFEKNPYREKEKRDYKAFYKLHHKQLVFYSEKNGFYKYYQNIIEYILEHSDVIIDYVTNDPQDMIFEKTSERFRTYYIGDKKIIPFMMKMDANVVVMTTPDLEKYHIKRSLVRKDIEYIYCPHSVNSPNMALRTGALDYFDTCFSAGVRMENEIREIEKLHNTKRKTIVRWGSSVLDNMIRDYEKSCKDITSAKTILIAPSWQEDNILDSCIEPLLNELLKTEYQIIVRPHPQYLRYDMEKINNLKARYSSCANFTLQTDFSSNETVFRADLLITDWSSIAFEYSFATLKPTLSINTPMKVMNPEWKKIELEPIDIAVRKWIGCDLELSEIDKVNDIVDKMIATSAIYQEKIKNVREQEMYNIGSSGQVGAEYILKAIERIEENKEEYLKYI